MTRSRRLTWLGAVLGLIAVLAATPGAGAVTATPTIQTFGVSAKISKQTLNGKSYALVRSISVRDVGTARPRVTCVGCLRYAGKITRSAKRGVVTFNGLNWLVTKKNVIRVNVSKAGSIGR